MSRDIRIDYPGDGAWIMRRVEGVFTEGTDHCIAATRDGEIIGGFALCDYIGAAITVHMAGDDRHWCSRDLLWMVFDYAFNQLEVHKLIAPVRSDNHLALALDTRAGFRLEAVLRDVYPGADMMVLTMTRAHCRWLNLRPRGWQSGKEAA